MERRTCLTRSLWLTLGNFLCYWLWARAVHCRIGHYRKPTWNWNCCDSGISYCFTDFLDRLPHVPEFSLWNFAPIKITSELNSLLLSAAMKERLLTVYGCTNLAENTCRLSSIRSFPTVLRCSTRWACSWVLGTVGHTWTPPPASPNGWPWGWMSWPSGRGVEGTATTDPPARASRTVPNHPRNPATSERTTQKNRPVHYFLPFGSHQSLTCKAKK